MRSKFLWALLTLSTTSAFAADWDRQLAASYLDSRQEEWFAWKAAKNGAAGGVCISCHTSMTYLLARPALRQALGEEKGTRFESGLMGSLGLRLDKKGKGG